VLCTHKKKAGATLVGETATSRHQLAHRTIATAATFDLLTTPDLLQVPSRSLFQGSYSSSGRDPTPLFFIREIPLFTCTKHRVPHGTTLQSVPLPLKSRVTNYATFRAPSLLVLLLFWAHATCLAPTWHDSIRVLCPLHGSLCPTRPSSAPTFHNTLAHPPSCGHIFFPCIRYTATMRVCSSPQEHSQATHPTLEHTILARLNTPHGLLDTRRRMRGFLSKWRKPPWSCELLALSSSL